MPDHFSVLGESRRPWIDPGKLKEKFIALSANAHPDRVHQAAAAEKRSATERYAELNTAHACLRDPRSRIGHLLELERGARPGVVREVPPNLMSLFFDVGRHLKEADVMLTEKNAAVSPLLKARVFARGQEISERLATMRRLLEARRTALDEELKSLNESWQQAESADARTPVLDRLEEIHGLLGYFSRWQAQLQERIVQLTL